MSKIAEVQAFEHTAEGAQVRVDHGGGSNKTAEHFAPPGDDSQPLPGDFAAVELSRGSGRETVSGYFDSKNQSKAAPGEVRRYARDASGAVVGEVWLKNDGAVIANGKGGSITIAPDGTMTAKSNATMVLDAPEVRVGKGAGRAIALVGDPVVVSVLPLPGPGQTNLTGSGQILGPGSIVGRG